MNEQQLAEYLKNNLSISLINNNGEVVVILKLNGEVVSSDYINIDG